MARGRRQFLRRQRPTEEPSIAEAGWVRGGERRRERERKAGRRAVRRGLRGDWGEAEGAL